MAGSSHVRDVVPHLLEMDGIGSRLHSMWPYLLQHVSAVLAQAELHLPLLQVRSLTPVFTPPPCFLCAAVDLLSISACSRPFRFVVLILA